MRALFIAVLLAVSAGVAHAGSRYVDPAVGWFQGASLSRGLDPLAGLLPAPGAPAPGEAPLRVLVTGDEVALAERAFLAGGRILSLHPGVMHAELTPAQIDFVAESEALDRLHVSRRLRPSLDVSRAAMHADQVQAGTGLDRPYTGKGVIVGVVDTGIDIRHPAFTNLDGSTRILAVWDQTVEYDDGSKHPAGFDYGIECTAEDINRFLRGAPALESCVTDDGKPIDGIPTEGHGTHVAGIAASSDAVYRGIAPDAALVVVRAHFEEGSILDGVHYVFNKCKTYGRPCVVNLSLGTTAGAHDGTAVIEQILAAETGPGRAIVAAAGNEATTDDQQVFGHVRLSRSGAGGLLKGPIFFPDSQYLNNDDYSAAVDVWNDGTAVTKFHVTAAEVNNQVVTVHNAFAGTFVEPPADGSLYTEPLQDAANKVWAYVHYATAIDPANKRRETLVAIDRCPGDPCVSGGKIDGAVSSFSRRMFILSVENSASDRIDMWPINASGLFFGPDPVSLDFTWPGLAAATHTLAGGDADLTITIPATSADVIAVGSYITKTSWTDVNGAAQAMGGQKGYLSAFSSRGPAGDGRVKPDVAAPGEWITSAHSKSDATLPKNWSPAEGWVNLLGTSMASPHVAGLVALMFERNPTLAPADLVGAKGLLTRNTQATAGSGTLPNSGFGYGAVDAAKVFADPAFAAVPETDVTAPKISSLKVSRSGSSVTVTWRTNEPADSRLELTAGGKTRAGGEASFVHTHRIKVSGLAAADYAVRVRSSDLAGNTASARGPTAEGEGCSCSAGRWPAPGHAWPFAVLAAVTLAQRLRRRR
jgi:subtilisin family serine protease